MTDTVKRTKSLSLLLAQGVRMIPAGEFGSTLQVLLLTYPLAVALLCLSGARFRLWRRRPA
jgi:hypothetical protein